MKKRAPKQYKDVRNLHITLEKLFWLKALLKAALNQKDMF